MLRACSVQRLDPFAKNALMLCLVTPSVSVLQDVWTCDFSVVLFTTGVPQKSLGSRSSRSDRTFELKNVQDGTRLAIAFTS